MWCEKCKGEYIDGITECPKCGVALTEEPQTARAIRKRQKQRFKRLKEQSKNYKEAFLVNSSSLIEYNYITTNLENMGITYRAVEEGAGNYLSILHGKSFAGCSIYVDKTKLDEARELLNTLEAEQQESELNIINISEEDEKEDAQEYGELPKGVKLFKMAFRIVVIIIVAVVVVVMLYSLISMLITLFESKTERSIFDFLDIKAR